MEAAPYMRINDCIFLTTKTLEMKQKHRLDNTERLKLKLVWGQGTLHEAPPVGVGKKFHNLYY